MKEVLMIIAEDNFQDIEFSETRKAILNNGFNVKIASKSKGIKKGVLGLEINAELSFDEIDENKFDAIVFIGGPGAARYIKDEKAWKLARKFFEANKIVAAICIAPLILAYSGILKGKKATVWDDGNQTQIKECTGRKETKSKPNPKTIMMKP